MSDLRELKARIDIIDVLEKIGARIDVDEWGQSEEIPVYCPFCEDKDSDNPAASANIVKNLYFCYACGVGGSIIDVVMAYQGHKVFQIAVSQAIKWLEENWPEEEEEDEDPWSGA